MSHEPDNPLQQEIQRLRQRVSVLEQQQDSSHLSGMARVFESIFQTIPDAIVFADMNRRILYANRATQRLFGYTPDELVNQSSRILYHNEHDYIEQGRLRFNENAPENIQPFEVLYRRKDGATFISETHGTVVRDPNGGVLGLIAIIRDISVRKEMEAALRKSEARLEEAQQLAHQGNWDWDTRTGDLYWSDESYRIFGFVPQAFPMTYVRFLECVHPDDQDFVVQAMSAALDGSPYSLFHRILLPDGEERIIKTQAEVTFDDEGNPVRMIGVMHDFTDYKRMENALRDQEAALRQIIDLVPQRIFAKDREGRFLLVNKALAETYHSTVDEVTGRNVQELDQNPAEIDQYQQDDLFVIEKQQRLVIPEEVFTDPDGNQHILHTTKIPFVMAGSKEPAVLGIAIDITEQKQAEQALKEANAMLASSRDALKRLIEQLPIGIQVFDETGLCIDVNQAHLETFGVSDRSQLVNAYNIFQDDLAARLGTQAAARRALAGETVNLGDITFDFSQADARFARTSGERVIHVTMFPVFDHEGRVVTFVGMNHDVTQRKQAEKQQLELAVQTERVNLLEELISDISHDLKTPLTIIGTSVYLLRKSIHDEPSIKYLERIKNQQDRLEKLIDGLLTMSRLNRTYDLEYERLDLAILLRQICSNKLPLANAKAIRLKLEVDKNPLVIEGESDELMRVFENLIDNAIYYTEDGGSITVKAIPNMDDVVIELHDTGIGIEADDLPHIFDRFYRADKARSADTGGTGLGLAIVKKIIDLHAGNVTVSSVPGSGSTFSVILPRRRPANENH